MKGKTVLRFECLTTGYWHSGDRLLAQWRQATGTVATGYSGIVAIGYWQSGNWESVDRLQAEWSLAEWPRSTGTVASGEWLNVKPTDGRTDEHITHAAVTLPRWSTDDLPSTKCLPSEM